MSTLLRVVAGLLMALALMYAKAGAQQPPACRDMLECQRERVADLRDYTEFLQSEVAYCKAVNKAVSADLATKQREIEALKKAAPDKEPPTP